VLGMGFSSVSEYHASSLLETLVSEKKLANGIFAFHITSDGGELYIGRVNKELYTGDITFVNVQPKVS
jgi:cathepsin D